MTATLMSSQPLTLDGEGATYSGTWCLVGEVLEWEIEGKTYRLESADDLSGVVRRFQKTLGDRILKDRIRLRACLTCKHFFMSSMARDMGRGQRGTCNVHRRGVEICFLCEKYQRSEI